jgi:hypothetical protein
MTNTASEPLPAIGSPVTVGIPKHQHTTVAVRAAPRGHGHDDVTVLRDREMTGGTDIIGDDQCAEPLR